MFTCVIPCILGYICCNLPTYAQYFHHFIINYIRLHVSVHAGPKHVGVCN
jgi:hypothetical protein